jgi:hypothetical protein
MVVETLTAETSSFAENIELVVLLRKNFVLYFHHPHQSCQLGSEKSFEEDILSMGLP